MIELPAAIKYRNEIRRRAARRAFSVSVLGELFAKECDSDTYMLNSSQTGAKLNQREDGGIRVESRGLD